METADIFKTKKSFLDSLENKNTINVLRLNDN